MSLPSQISLSLALIACLLWTSPASADPGEEQEPATQPAQGDGEIIEEVLDPSIGTGTGKRPDRARPSPSRVPLLTGLSIGCGDGVVANVRIEGCGKTPCGDPEVQARLRSLTDLVEGSPINDELRERLVNRLMETGFFQSVNFRCIPLDQTGEPATDVVVLVRPNTFVRKAKIYGNVYFRERELSKRVFLRAGSVLNATPGREFADETVQRQVDSLKRLYRREGLENVEILVEVSRAAPGMVDVAIRIEEGDRQRIRSLDLVHERPPQAASGDATERLECPAVTRRQLAALTGKGLGQVVTSKDLRTIRKRTEIWFQSIGYVRPVVEVKAEGRPLTLSMHVKTDRCWLLRVWEREAALAGSSSEPAYRQGDPFGSGLSPGARQRAYQRVEFEDWRQVLPFGESGVFDRDEAERGVLGLSKVLGDMGYLFADVRMEHRRFERSKVTRGSRQTGVIGTIDYLLTRNLSRRLRSLTIVGNDTYPQTALSEEMDTTPYDFFAEGGQLLLDQLLFDLTKVKRFYRTRGFYRFRYGLQGKADDVAPSRTLLRDGEWLVWEYRFRDRGFRVRKHQRDLSVDVEIPLIEGPRTRIAKVHLEGNEELATVKALDVLKLHPGEPYDRNELELGLGRLEAWYHRQGYHQFAAMVECSLGEERPEGADPDGAGGCDPMDVQGARVELTVTLVEGPQTLVGEVMWRGNFKTDARVLVRDLPESGEPYDPSRITEAARKLRNLGVFDAVQVERIGLDESPPRDKLAVVVSVEEAESRFVDMAVGFRTIDREVDKNKKAPPWLGSVLGQQTALADRTTTGFGRPFALSLPDVLLKLEAEYVDANFRGQAHRFRVPFRFGFSTTDPLRLLSLTPTVTVPRLFESSVHMDLKLLAELDQVTEQLDRTELGVSASLTFPLARQMSMGISVDAGAISFSDPELDAGVDTLDLISEGLTPQVRPFVRWRWDTQDNPLNPTRGFALAASAGYILEIDRETVANSRTTVLNDFVKWEASAEGAHETRLGPILAGMIHYGGSLGEGDSLLPPNERFTLGGTTGMRGFADHAVGRYDADGSLVSDLVDIEQLGGGNVVLNGSLEARFPLIRNAGVWLGVFLDAGLLGRTHADLHPKALRASSGLGIRYLIGNQIPVRLDWGFVLGGTRCLEWRADDPGGTCQTEEDPTAFHFDLLYPF